MAKGQGFSVNSGSEKAMRTWIGQSSKADNWGNAREMRTLLEKARDSQALRLSKGDITAENLDVITKEDILAAIGS